MSKAWNRIVDIMNVPPEGDTASAIVPTTGARLTENLKCDVLVVGGGMGGVAAAWASARSGRTVILLEETDWIGGQMTSQGVSALDEHDEIERRGGTRTYYELRRKIRQHYRPGMTAAEEPQINPGNCWVSRVAFEPRVGLEVLQALLRPEVAAGRLQIRTRCKAFSAEMAGSRITGVNAINLDQRTALRIECRLAIDATELGDLLPLTGTGYVVGAETVAETGEKHAQPHAANADCVQSCTYTFALERRPEGEMHRIARPTHYERYRDGQPYGLRIHVYGGEIYGEETGWLQYRMFDTLPGTKGGLWQYRRLVDAAVFSDAARFDVSMFNWPGIDYRDRSLLEQTPEMFAQSLQDAKRVSLGFLHWLQSEIEPAGARRGYPNLLLRPDVMGTRDGLSKHPYIRESRRIRALRTVVEQDVSVESQTGLFSQGFPDSVGIGWYPIDIHNAGPGDVGVSIRTKPFQIPLGALIPVGRPNLLAAAKNIGTTHVTNGCYRLHPVEWNIGESAGLLAHFSLKHACSPEEVWRSPQRLNDYQELLKGEGVTLAWE